MVSAALEVANNQPPTNQSPIDQPPTNQPLERDNDNAHIGADLGERLRVAHQREHHLLFAAVVGVVAAAVVGVAAATVGVVEFVIVTTSAIAFVAFSGCVIVVHVRVFFINLFFIFTTTCITTNSWLL